MPYLKFINGHSTSLFNAYRYLEGKDGNRAVAFDGVNLCHESLFDPNLLWYQSMDAIRKIADNNRSTTDKRARTYMHFIISPDPRDNISLDEFRGIVTAWSERFFDSDKLGSYQVAIIYHNDNKERIEKGGEGILHAHIIVNNTDLNDGKRIAPKLTRRIINDMYFEINKAALAAGYHGFAADGKSYTQREMVELGLSPSRNRNDARRLDDRIDDHHIPDEEVVLDGILPEEGASRVVDPSEIKDDEPPARPRNKPDFQMVFATGEVYDLYERAPRSHRTMPERRVHEREGHSWKEDIRGRVDVAVRLAGGIGEFKQILGLLGVDVRYNKRGEIKYCLRGDENRAKQVLGKTLGARYTKERIYLSIGLNHRERVQRMTSDAPMRRQISKAERTAVVGAMREATMGTREGAGLVRLLKSFLKYNDVHNIRTYDDYPDTRQGRAARRWAEEHRALEPDRFVPIAPEQYAKMSPEDRIEYRAMLRERLGYGGIECGARETGRVDSGRKTDGSGTDGPSRGMDIGAR